MTDPQEAAVNAADPDEDEDVEGAQDGVVEPGLPAGDDPGDQDPNDDDGAEGPEDAE